jgi:hypothetical protein
MAAISERGGVWRAQVRKAGQPSISRSFDTREQATTWATEMETPTRRTQANQIWAGHEDKRLRSGRWPPPQEHPVVRAADGRNP